MTTLILFLIISGVTVLPKTADTPRCPHAPREELIQRAGTEEEVLARMVQDVRDAGGDTLKVTKTRIDRELGIVEFRGYGFRCEGGDGK